MLFLSGDTDVLVCARHSGNRFLNVDVLEQDLWLDLAGEAEDRIGLLGQRYEKRREEFTRDCALQVTLPPKKAVLRSRPCYR